MGRLKTMTFNGVCTNELGLVLTSQPAYEYPEKDYTVQHIAGRTGDIVTDNGSYKNVQRTYNLAMVFSKEGNATFEWGSGVTPLTSNNFVERVNKIVKWIMDAKGYCELEDEYEPDYYRLAMIYASGALSNIYNQATALSLNFECKPQRWLKTGKTYINIPMDEYESEEPDPTYYWTRLTNNWKETKPIIKLNSYHTDDSGYVTIEIYYNNTLPAISYGKIKLGPCTTAKNIIIDCENMEVYDDQNNSLNNLVVEMTLPEKMIFIPENKTIQIDINLKDTNSTISSASIRPNWWTL